MLRDHTGGVASLDWSPDDERIVTAGHDHKVKMWYADVSTHHNISNGRLESVYRRWNITISSQYVAGSPTAKTSSLLASTKRSLYGISSAQLCINGV